MSGCCVWSGVKSAKCFHIEDAHLARPREVSASVKALSREGVVNQLVTQIKPYVSQEVPDSSNSSRLVEKLIPKEVIQHHLTRHSRSSDSVAKIVLEHYRVILNQLPDCSETQKKSLGAALGRQLDMCTNGFVNTLTQMVLGFREYQTFEGFLYLLSEKIIERSAIRHMSSADTQTIHTESQFKEVAALHYGYRHAVADPNARIQGVSDQTIKQHLDQQFLEDFHPINIFLHQVQAIKEKLAFFGYTGSKTAPDSYEQLFFEPTKKFFERYFGLASESSSYEDWLLIIEDETSLAEYCIDVDWLKLINRMIQKMLQEGYLVLNVADIEALQSAGLYTEAVVASSTVPSNAPVTSLFSLGTLQQQVEFVCFLDQFPMAKDLTQRLMLQLDKDPSHNLLKQIFETQLTQAVSLLKMFDKTSIELLSYINTTQAVDFKTLDICLESNPRLLEHFLSRENGFDDANLQEWLTQPNANDELRFFRAVFKSVQVLQVILKRIDEMLSSEARDELLKTLLCEKDSNGWNPLMVATEFYPESVESLLRRVDAMEPQSARDELLKTLLCEKNSEGWNALMNAAYCHPESVAAEFHPEAVESLLRRVDAMEPKSARDELLKTLLCEKDSQGWNALMNAAFCHPESVESLLRRVDAMEHQSARDELLKTLLLERNSKGINSLTIAAELHPEAVESLLRRVDAMEPQSARDELLKTLLCEKDSQGWNALMNAAYCHPESVESLLRRVDVMEHQSARDELLKALLFEKNRQGWNALMIGAQRHPKVVAVILNRVEKMADPLAREGFFKTIMSQASSGGWNVLMLLVHYCPEILWQFLIPLVVESEAFKMDLLDRLVNQKTLKFRGDDHCYSLWKVASLSESPEALSELMRHLALISKQHFCRGISEIIQDASISNLSGLARWDILQHIDHPADINAIWLRIDHGHQAEFLRQFLIADLLKKGVVTFSADDSLSKLLLASKHQFSQEAFQFLVANKKELTQIVIKIMRSSEAERGLMANALSETIHPSFESLLHGVLWEKRGWLATRKTAGCLRELDRARKAMQVPVELGQG